MASTVRPIGAKRNVQKAPVNPAALRKTMTRLASQGHAAINEAVALRGQLAALQAMTADAAYGALSEGFKLRRGLYQRNQVGGELAPATGRLVEYHPPQVPLGRTKEGPALNWGLLFARGFLTALFAALLLLPSVASAATEAQLRTALVQAHRDVHGKAPGANRLAVAMAQVGLEVGRGKAVTCNNIGQIAAPRKAPHCYTKGGFRVRSYPSLRASAAAYWRLRAVRRALPAFDAGDPVAAAYALKRGGYYTAPAAVYAERMQAVYREQNR